MPRLKETRLLPLVPYKPKPGDSMDTHADVSLYRDTDRKIIVFSISTLSINGNMRGFRLGGPGKRMKVADAKTHAPKEFARLAKQWIGCLDDKEGESWGMLVTLLAENGMELADAPAMVE